LQEQLTLGFAPARPVFHRNYTLSYLLHGTSLVPHISYETKPANRHPSRQGLPDPSDSNEAAPFDVEIPVDSGPGESDGVQVRTVEV
jgi:hypothetical protein